MRVCRRSSVPPRQSKPGSRIPRYKHLMQTLTFKQKQSILDEYKKRKANGMKTTQSALAEWAKEALSLPIMPNQSTISRLLRDVHKISNIPIHQNLNNKKARSAAAPKLEDALYKWICTHSNRGVIINSEIICIEAGRLMSEVNKLLPPTNQLKLKFSKGWIERFKKRYGLRFRRVHGEALSADNDAVSHQMPRIERIVMTFANKDVWNADEFGLYYRQPSGWTLCKRAVSGHKKEKSRLTFLACCNSDGSEKMPLMIIGHAERPRPFGRKYGRDLGFDYHFNKKAWMNTNLFFEWLRRLDRYIGMESGRKILLLIDNCSAHGKEETMPHLDNVRVLFLPPNTTSKVQPLDAGIIAWVKNKYRTRLLLRVFDNIDMGRKSIYNVDVLTAMRWTTEAWSACPPAIFKNCFLHCLKSSVEIVEEERGVNNSDVVDQMERDANEHGVTFTKVALESLLCPEAEDDVTEVVTMQSLANDVANIDDQELVEHVYEDHDDEVESLSMEKELETLALARSILERHGDLCDVSRNAFGNCQRRLRIEKTASMKQSTILDHFVRK